MTDDGAGAGEPLPPPTTSPTEPTRADDDTPSSPVATAPSPPAPTAAVSSTLRSTLDDLTEREPTPIRPSWVAAAAIGAVAADVGLRRPPWNNVSGTLAFVALIAALWITGVVHTRTGKALLVVAGLLALCLSWRSDPYLSTFNFFATAGLITFAGFHGRGRSIWRWTPLQAVDDAIHLIGQGLETLVVELPAEGVARLRSLRSERSTRAGAGGSTPAIIRGIALALPILVVLGLLLASADAVFESIFSSLGITNWGFNGWPLIGHLVLLTFGAVGTIVMLRIAATAPDTKSHDRLFTVGSIESTIVLVGINVLFAIFAGAQLLTIAGGADAALERAGVDPKEFARQGFFQLLWVAALTLMVLLALHSTRDPHDGRDRRFRLLSMLTVALTLMIVVVALTRLGFYVGEEGLTPLRFYSSVFSLWIALCLALAAARIVGWRAQTPWLTSALIVAAAVVGLVLNVANPEAIMAQDNLDRDHEHLVYHLRPEHRQFSGDGWAVIADGLPTLSSPIAADVKTQLCREHGISLYNDGPLHFNVGKWRGDRALNDLCGTESGLFD